MIVTVRFKSVALGVFLAGLGPMLMRADVDAVDETSITARELVLERVDAIGHDPGCLISFDSEQIDLRVVREVALKTRFYRASGPEGLLRFSKVIGRAATPDLTLRELARRVPADAFVLGYQEGPQYVRIRHVVLNTGYYGQGDAAEGTWRLTTVEEKQNLLLHELLHLALDVGDDCLNRLQLSPTKLIAFCPRSREFPDARPSTE